MRSIGRLAAECRQARWCGPRVRCATLGYETGQAGIDAHEVAPHVDSGAGRRAALGAALRGYRVAAGLTQEELARGSGISVRAISDIERGRTTRPFMRSIRLLADAMTLTGAARRQLMTAAHGGTDDEAFPGSGGRLADQPGRVPWPAVVPRQLPPAVRHFTGRTNDLMTLHRLLDQAWPGSQTVVIAAIGGTAGVGKTALAVQFAHQVAARFPDGQLYVDLRGFGPVGTPVPQRTALRGFLDALMIPPTERPARLEDLAGLYRSLLAERAMLVLLDNARDASHVRLLLPGSPGSMVVVTSRNDMTGLAATNGAHLLTLDLLDKAEARELLASHLGQERVAAAEDATGELINMCARLPLALSVAAARAAARRGIPLAAIVSELRNLPERLDALDAGDEESNVRAVLSWSYLHLGDQEARMFRLLSVHPGPDVSLRAAASLAGVPAATARRLLTGLAHAGLVREHVPGRYACHDLLRTYAGECALGHDSEGERRAAIHRVLDHYLHTAHAAAMRLRPERHPIALPACQPGTCPEGVTSYEEALTWFKAEHKVLLAVIAQAAMTGFDAHAWQIPWTLTHFLDWQGHWLDWLTTQQTALAAARRAGDLRGHALAADQLGSACIRLGSYQDAFVHLFTSLDLYSRLGDGLGEARVHHDIGWVFERQGRYVDALEHGKQALHLYRAEGDKPGQAVALNAVGWCHAMQQNYRQALSCCRRALALHRALGNLHAEAATLDSLGYAHHHLGHHDEAAACYQQAVALCRELGERFYLAETLRHLGDAYQRVGSHEAARDAWCQALDILDAMHHPDAGDLRRKFAPTAVPVPAARGGDAN